MKINKHQGLSIFYILFGLLLLYLTSNIHFMFSVSSEDVGPKFFPYCCSIGIIICGVGKLLTSKNKEGKIFIKDKEGWLKLLLILAVFIAYLVSINYLGFIFSSIVLGTILPFMLATQDKRPSLWKVIIFSVVLTLITYFIFTKLINVFLPTGKLIKMLLRALR